MTQLLPTAPSRGTRDFLPAEMSVRQQVFHRLYQVIESFGYARYDGPVLESAEIYEAKSGTELVDQQLYTLVDRGGRKLALRPEMTPTVARMIAGNANTLTFPVRWYSHPNCHRYERPQRGRVREHWQINVDIFGSQAASCEVEIFEMIHGLMGSLGAERSTYRLRVSDRALLPAVFELSGVPSGAHRDMMKIVDRWEKTDRESLKADASALGLSASGFDTLTELLTKGAAIFDDLSPEVRAQSQLAKVLDDGGGSLIDIDLLIVRGLDYYTSTVFEVFDTSPENPRALFGGGRYENLAGLFTKQEIPGIGFGMGDVTLMDYLETHGLKPEPLPASDIHVLGSDPALLSTYRDVAARLREEGLRVTTPLEAKKLAKLITQANKAGVDWVVLVMPDEWAEGKVVVRHLPTSQQSVVPLTEAAAFIQQGH